MKDFYYILGTAVTSTPAEITEAYQKLSKKIYPDLNDDDNYFRDRFMEVREAYNTLIDPVKRKRYDEELNKFNTSKLRSRSKTKSLDIVSTLILLIFTVLFGSYVFKSIYGTKTHQIYQNVSEPVITKEIKPKAWHRKKGYAKVKHTELSKHAILIKSPQQEVAVKPVIVAKPVTKVVDSVKKVPLIAAVPVVPSKVIQEVETSEAQIRSNETGVVYMREFERYNSAVIKVLPDRTKVQVLEKGDKYFKVQFERVAGYVPKWTVQLN